MKKVKSKGSTWDMVKRPARKSKKKDNWVELKKHLVILEENGLDHLTFPGIFSLMKAIEKGGYNAKRNDRKDI